MLKSEEISSSKLDILHNNYKIKYSSYKKFIDFIDKIRKLYLSFSENVDNMFSRNYSSITENQPSSLVTLLSSIETHIKWQGTEFNKLSKLLYKEIVETFKLLKDSNDRIEENIYKELNELNRALKKSKIKLEENRNIYINKMKNLEKLMTEEKTMKINITSGNYEIKDKKKMMSDLMIDCKNEEAKYEKNINEVNNNLDKVREKESMIIGFYKGCEVNRINKIKDYANFLLKTIQDQNVKINNIIDNIFKKTEIIESEKDIIAFEKLVEQNYKAEKNIEFIPYKPMASLDNSLKITEKKSKFNELSINYEIITTLQKNFKQIYSKLDMNEEKEKYDLRNLCFRLLDKEQNINFLKEDLDNLLSFITKEKYRTYFLKYLTGERTGGKFERSEKIINELGIILNQILIYAEKEKNYDNAKNCIILSQTFYVETKDNNKDNNDDEENKIYLMSLLGDSKWIHDINFWQEMIEIEIINEKFKFNEQNPCMDREKVEESFSNVYFSKILTYSHNMCIFGIEKKLALDLCEVLAEKYKLTAQFKEILLNSIEDMYNPNKTKPKNKNKKNDTDNKKEKEKVKEKEKENTNQDKKKQIEDDWVICNYDNNKNNKNKTDNFLDDFIIEGNSDNDKNNDNKNEKEIKEGDKK